MDHFSILAPVYDKLIRGNHRGKLTELADLPVKGMLLDVGGGTGRVAEQLRDLVGRAVVLDLSHGMLRKASIKEGLDTANAKSESLPFPEETFERIIMVDAFHHVYDQALTANELWRVLERGGRLVIEEPDIRLPSVKLVALVEKLALMRSHFLSPEKIAELFHYPHARKSLAKEGYNAWIVVEKQRHR